MMSEKIDDFIRMRITLADAELAGHACTKIYDGDVIVTFGHSYPVVLSLLEAWSPSSDRVQRLSPRRFTVVVLDSRPRNEGRHTVEQLSAVGIPTIYAGLHAAPYVISRCSKVFLGAAAMLSNGTMVSRAGSATVACMAHTLGIPVIVCCETYKFLERVQLDSICSNELADPDELVSCTGVYICHVLFHKQRVSMIGSHWIIYGY